LDVALVKTVEQPMKLVRDAGLRQRVAIGVCRDGKSIGDSDPFGRESRIQFAKRRGLAADKSDVAQANFEKRSDIFCHSTSKSGRICPVLREVNPLVEIGDEGVLQCLDSALLDQGCGLVRDQNAACMHQNSLLLAKNSLFLEIFSLLIFIGNCVRSHCSTAVCCWEIGSQSPRIIEFPVKFPVSGRDSLELLALRLAGYRAVRTMSGWD